MERKQGREEKKTYVKKKEGAGGKKQRGGGWKDRVSVQRKLKSKGKDGQQTFEFTRINPEEKSLKPSSDEKREAMLWQKSRKRRGEEGAERDQKKRLGAAMLTNS